jgi:ferritin-like protein
MPQIPFDRIKLEPIIYPHLQIPNGMLGTHREEHALWYYYTIARFAYESIELNPVVYEGEDDPEVDYKAMRLSVARLYGVLPDEMTRAWQIIDSQCDWSQVPRMPTGAKYRGTSS